MHTQRESHTTQMSLFAHSNEKDSGDSTNPDFSHKCWLMKVTNTEGFINRLKNHCTPIRSHWGLSQSNRAIY